MLRKVIVGALYLTLLGVFITSPALAAQVAVDQVNLRDEYEYSNNPWDIFPDGHGNLIVSDDGRIIWKINPVNGNYSLIDTAVPNLASLASARPAEGGYYFSDFDDYIGFTNLTSSTVWKIPYEVNQLDHSLDHVNIDSSGKVWFIENDSSDSKVYFLTRLNTSATVCTLTPVTGLPNLTDYGTYAYDLDYHGGYLWWFNWYAKKIVRLNPVPDGTGRYLMVSWSVPVDSTAIGGRENDFDTLGNLWIPGGASGTILRFNPATETLTIYDSPTAGRSMEGLTISNNKVWFADLNGAVGVLDPLDPGVVIRSETDLSSEYHAEYFKTFDPCSVLSGITTTNYPSQSGTLPFIDRAVTPDTTHPGWMIFPLGDEEPSGINTAQGVVLVSAPHSDFTLRKLLRFKIENGTEYQVYLPLILR